MREFDGFFGATAFYTDRLDGNFADYVGDSEDGLRDRREIFCARFEGRKVVILKQVHGDDIVEVKADSVQKSSGGFYLAGEADGMTTNKEGVVLAIQTADCAAVLLYDPRFRAVSALHAGRKGAGLNILSKCVSKMSALYGSKANELIMAVSPHVRGCCYELPAEMAAEFEIYENAVTKKEAKTYLDIAAVLKAQAAALGIKNENIHIVNDCTSCKNDLYFSYRAENGRCGRMISGVGV